MGWERVTKDIQTSDTSSKATTAYIPRNHPTVSIPTHNGVLSFTPPPMRAPLHLQIVAKSAWLSPYFCQRGTHAAGIPASVPRVAGACA